MTKGRRLAAQLLLLPALYVASLPDPRVFGIVVSAALLLPPIWTGGVAALLVYTSRQIPEVETLRERADDAVTSFLQALGYAAVGVLVLASTLGIILPGRPTVAFLAWVGLLISVPALGWARTWRTYWLPLLRRRLGVADPDEEPAESAPGT